jgi:type IV pilus assembly protein PilE
MLIVLAVLAILAALAMPSFAGALRKAHRSEAITALATLQQAQERWRSNSAVYSATLTELKFPASTTPGGRYTVAIEQAGATGYVASARAVGGQLHDAACAHLAVRMELGVIGYASCSNCSTFEPATFAPTNSCWSR